MTIDDLLGEIEAHGVRLGVRLVVEAPDAFQDDPRIQAALRTFKPELLAYAVAMAEGDALDADPNRRRPSLAVEDVIWARTNRPASIRGLCESCGDPADVLVNQECAGDGAYGPDGKPIDPRTLPPSKLCVCCARGLMHDPAAA